MEAGGAAQFGGRLTSRGVQLAAAQRATRARLASGPLLAQEAIDHKWTNVLERAQERTLRCLLSIFRCIDFGALMLLDFTLKEVGSRCASDKK